MRSAPQGEQGNYAFLPSHLERGKPRPTKPKGKRLGRRGRDCLKSFWDTSVQAGNAAKTEN